MRHRGLDGRQLQENDILKIGNENIRPAKIGARIDDSFIPQFSNQHEIRVVLGLCSYRLTEESKERFFPLIGLFQQKQIGWAIASEGNV